MRTRGCAANWKGSSVSELDGYITVDERVKEFQAEYPEGRIYVKVKVESGRVLAEAEVTRWPGDINSAWGHGSCLFPGETPYTYGSEVENAETSAIGRALFFLGFSKGKAIASAQEVKQNSEAITDKAADHLLEVVSKKDAKAVKLALAEVGKSGDVEAAVRSLTPFEAKRFGERLAA